MYVRIYTHTRGIPQITIPVGDDVGQCYWTADGGGAPCRLGAQAIRDVPTVHRLRRRLLPNFARLETTRRFIIMYLLSLLTYGW